MKVWELRIYSSSISRIAAKSKAAASVSKRLKLMNYEAAISFEHDHYRNKNPFASHNCLSRDRSALLARFAHVPCIF